MPRFLTKAMQGKRLYFDLRPNGQGEADGTYAQPIFHADEQRIERDCAKNGQSENAWKEKLVFAITGVDSPEWYGFCDMESKPIPCTPEAVRDLCESDPAQMRSILIIIQSAAQTARVDAEKN